MISGRIRCDACLARCRDGEPPRSNAIDLPRSAWSPALRNSDLGVHRRSGHQGDSFGGGLPAFAGLFPPCVMDNAKKKKDKEVSAPTDAGPLKVIRIDDVSASIFARDRKIKDEDVTFYSVSFSRSYKSADGEWKYTKNFDEEDLGSVMTLAKQASEFILSERGLTTATQED